MYRQKVGKMTKASLQILSGSLTLKEFGLPFKVEKVEVTLAGKVISVVVNKSSSGVVVKFAQPVCINADEILSIN